jgi:hypothetical protein
MSTFQQFRDRVRDLNALLKLISQLEQQRPAIPGHFTIDIHPLSVLKASVFIVIYNLVESTIRTGFESLYREIELQGLTYDTLRAELRTLWIDQQFRHKMDLYSASPRTYFDKIKELVDSVHHDAVLRLDSTRLPLSGNLDAHAIREVCKRHGVSGESPPATRGGEDLTVVKAQRNNLAHGNTTFSECGRDYSVTDLRRISVQAVNYLRAILKNIERYGKSRLYAAP